MNIAVCEDDARYRCKLAAQIKKCIKLNIPVDEYDSVDALLETYESGMRYDLLFLDIQMPGISGIDVAMRIKQMNRNTLFVFIAFTPFESDAFLVRAVTYIDKTMNVEYLNMESVIERCILEYMEIMRQIPMPTEEGILDVHIRAIEYAESKGRKVLLHLKTEEIICINLQLKEVLAKLQTFDFKRCHRRYLINLYSIDSFTDKTIKINSGAEIPVSSKLLSSVEQARNEMIIRKMSWKSNI